MSPKSGGHTAQGKDDLTMNKGIMYYFEQVGGQQKQRKKNTHREEGAVDSKALSPRNLFPPLGEPGGWLRTGRSRRKTQKKKALRSEDRGCVLATAEK